MALEIAIRTKPDMILTDIKMPVMNGIELIREIKRLAIPSKVVVLSAYDDFHYVREALKLGAQDYVLKLDMMPDDMLRMLNQLKEQTPVQPSIPLSNQSISHLKEQLLKDLILGWARQPEEIQNRLAVLEMKLPETFFECMIIKVEDAGLYDKYGEKDVHILDYAVRNIVEEILHNHNGGYTIQLEPKELIVLLCVQASHSSYERYQYNAKLSDALKASLKKYVNLVVFVGVSGTHPGYVNIPKCYQEAKQTLQQRFFHPRGSTLFFEGIKSQDSVESAESRLQERLKQLQNAMNSKDTEFIEASFNAMEQAMKEHVQSKEQLLRVCSSIAFLCAEITKDTEMPRFEVQEDALLWLQEHKQRIISSFRLDDDSSRRAKHVVRYIQQHYSEPITLETAAEHMSLSPGYLSSIFKKETGETFVNYLTQIRVEKAKELIQTNRYKLYEVSKLVGYESEYYFSRVFKKITGVSPKHFKYK